MIVYQAGTSALYRTFWEYVKGMRDEEFLSNDADLINVDMNIGDINILESYYYYNNRWQDELFAKCKHTMLDSGAFTFIQDKRKAKGEVDWVEYTRRYARLINRLKVKNYIELDIENIIGMAQVEYLRSLLEDLTGVQAIPVFHRGRGKDYWFKMIENYSYVALGGIAGTADKGENSFHWFLSTARKEGTKVHALGYTSMNLWKYKFHSVDSTAWTMGARVGCLYYFKQGRIKKYDVTKEREGKRFHTRRTLAKCLDAWVKFGKYAEVHL